MILYLQVYNDGHYKLGASAWYFEFLNKPSLWCFINLSNRPTARKSEVRVSDIIFHNDIKYVYFY